MLQLELDSHERVELVPELSLPGVVGSTQHRHPDLLRGIAVDEVEDLTTPVTDLDGILACLLGEFETPIGVSDETVASFHFTAEPGIPGLDVLDELLASLVTSILIGLGQNASGSSESVGRERVANLVDVHESLLLKLRLVGQSVKKLPSESCWNLFFIQFL